MDESWRMPIGSWRRRSAGDYSRRDIHLGTGASLSPDDFKDVFGGPPRTVLRRYHGACKRDDKSDRFYEGSSSRDAFYEGDTAGRKSTDLDRQPWSGIPGGKTVRSTARERWWSAFRTEEGFFDDIFGSDGNARRRSGRRGDGEPRRSRTRSCESSWSKSNSSTVTGVSSEDLSPLARFTSTVTAAEDGVLSAFASMLRPITIPIQRHNTPSPPFLPTTYFEDSAAIRSSPSNGNSNYDLPWSKPSFADERWHRSFGSFRGARLSPLPHSSGRHSQHQSSPDSITIDASTLWSLRKTASSVGGNGDAGEDTDDNDKLSSASTSSTISMNREEMKAAMEELGRAVVVELNDEELWGEQEAEEEEGEEDDDDGTDAGPSPWFARMMAVDRSTAEASTSSAVDEAIAWAREKFLIRMPDEDGRPKPDGILGRLEENKGMVGGMGITA